MFQLEQLSLAANNTLCVVNAKALVQLCHQVLQVS